MSSENDFSFALSMDAAIDTADPVPVELCATCQRIGLPILPLRAAYAPRPLETQALPLTRDSEVRAVRLHTDQPRTLRRGFLYVLLDRRVWHAYQITPEGVLRQFPAYQTPLEEPRPLTEICIMDDHDIPAAFLNIDADKYSTALLAIANDPWPPAVLDRYLQGGVVDGMRLEDRFYELDLKAARDDPASVGIAMTPNEMGIYHVLEYAQSITGDFRSVHGFYTRNHRLRALMGHVRTVTQQYKLPNGVLALVLPDPIGMVQELNAQRMLRYEAMQAWRAEPQRNFEFFTSEALLGIRNVQLEKAKERAIKDAEAAVENQRQYNARPQSYRAPLPELDLEKEKQRRTVEEQADAIERLKGRYDEEARSTFEKNYTRTMEHWQRIIDIVAEPYVKHHDGAAFRLAGKHDYSVTSTDSVAAFILMNRMCIAGSVTDRYTRELWKRQLESLKTEYYQALTGRDKIWQEQLADDLIDGEQTRSYHAIKTFITTDAGKELMVAPIQDAIGDLLAAGAAASYALGDELSKQARALVGNLHREALLRYSGVQVTQFTVSLKIGEYLTLLNEVLYEGTERFITQLDEQFRNPAKRKVRAMLLKGAFTPALASGHATLIDIKVWTMESAEELQARLGKLSSDVGAGVDDVFRHVSIDPTALKGSMADYARHISVNAETARLMVRDSLRSLHSAGKTTGPGKFTMGLAMGSLYFQVDALTKSYENMLRTVGDGQAEAVAAVMSASVGVIGAGVESVGAAIQIVRPDLTVKVVGLAGRETTVALGYRIVQWGGALVALASAVEGGQFVLAAERAKAVGDNAAVIAYRGSALAALFSSGAGIIGSLVPSAVALFPLSIAVLLGLVAYGAAVLAKKLESDALELWARYSLWGIPQKHRRWMTPEDMDTAIGVLNAAWLGVTADASLNVNAERTGGIPVGDAVPAGLFLDYNIVLPGYVSGTSRYEWALQVYRTGQAPGETIAHGVTGGTNEPLPPPVSWKNPGYRPETTVPLIQNDAGSGTLEIRGSISFFGTLEVRALQLEVSYWPDKNDEGGVARLIVKEDKIGGVVKWDFL
ncbi:T6SS effector BTH_I2691 family protein [Pseudomonas wadenswilerensis]